MLGTAEERGGGSIYVMLLNWHFVLGEQELSIAQLGLVALVYKAIHCGWIGALVEVRGEGRRPLIGSWCTPLCCVSTPWL